MKEACLFAFVCFPLKKKIQVEQKWSFHKSKNQLVYFSEDCSLSTYLCLSPFSMSASTQDTSFLAHILINAT